MVPRRGIKRPFVKGRKVDPSAVPPTFGDAALWPTGRALVAAARYSRAVPPATPTDRCCPVSLALCAGAYWRALEARGLVRRLTGPFVLVAAPACTNRWFSTPAPGGTRPDHSPYSDVARSLRVRRRRCQPRPGTARPAGPRWIWRRFRWQFLGSRAAPGSTSTPRCGACRCRGPCRGRSPVPPPRR